MLNIIKNFINDESGITAIEYGFIAAGVAVILGALVANDGVFSETLNTLFDNIVEQMPEASSGE